MATFSSFRHEVPRLPPFSTVASGFQATTSLTGATQRQAWILQVPKAGTLRRFIPRTGTVTTPNDLRFSFQALDSSANPDLTEAFFLDFLSAGVASNSYLTPGGALTDDGTGGGNKLTVARGDLIGCVVRPLGSCNLAFSFTVYGNSGFGHQLQAPVTNYYNGSSWVGKNNQCNNLVLEYDDGTYAEIGDLQVIPFHAFNTPSFASNSTPDERGAIWTPDFTLKVRGIGYKGSSAEAHDVVFYTGTSATETLTIDPDYRDSINAGWKYVFFTGERTLTAGVTYRFIIKPTTTSATTLLHDYEVANAAYLDALPLGQAFHYSERTDGGAFTETTTKRPMMGFLISAIQTDPGLSALIVHPGMQGGMRG
jgi:hypothetical protein